MEAVCETCATFSDMMALRATVYRMLGSVYFTELTTEQIEALAAWDFASFADLDIEMAEGAKEVARALRHIHSGTREELAVDYAHTFLAAGSGKTEMRAVPYESVYTSESGLLMGPARQSVYRIMAGEGVLPDVSLHVPEDHLSFECEFMAVLAERSVSAFESGDVDEARRLLELSATFREEHIANWVEDLCSAIEATCRTRFYRGFALVTRAFIRLDGELLAECAAVVEG